MSAPDDRPTPRHAEAIARGEAAWERIRGERAAELDAALAEGLRGWGK